MTGSGGSDLSLIRALRDGLSAAATPGKAGPMQAYMKSTMPFYGVPSPDRRRIVREVVERYPIHDRSTWAATVVALWNDAVFREERYVAIDLTGIRQARGWQDVATLPMYEHMIVTGAWWDYVDELAIRRVGVIHRADRAAVAPMLRAWAVDHDRWRRRTAILAQIGAKRDTDVELLAEVITANLDDGPITRDFFVRKAIGWALRDYAKTDPEWVRSFVGTYRDRLSALSLREATKHLATVR